MGRRLLGAGIGLLALALSTPSWAADAVARTPSVITRPDWAEKPTGEDMERFYPEKAKTEDRGGRATLTCTVTAEGTLVRCSVFDETPKDYGFGQAALSLSKMFRMKPKTVDGKAVNGGAITIPIIFSVPPKMELGDGAIALIKIDPAATRPPANSIVTCPDRQGECQIQDVIWLSRPDAAQSARILANLDPGEEHTGAQCVIGSDGLLYACAFLGDGTPRAAAAARETIKLLRAAATTKDGASTDMVSIFVPFVWEELTKSSPVEPKP
jgi:TonB family protein